MDLAEFWSMFDLLGPAHNDILDSLINAFLSSTVTFVGDYFDTKASPRWCFDDSRPGWLIFCAFSLRTQKDHIRSIYDLTRSLRIVQAQLLLRARALVISELDLPDSDHDLVGEESAARKRNF